MEQKFFFWCKNAQAFYIKRWRCSRKFKCRMSGSWEPLHNFRPSFKELPKLSNEPTGENSPYLGSML
jgi:hypothetical protein